MQLLKILTSLAASTLLTAAAPAWAQRAGDDVLLDMQQAARRGDRARLTQLLPQARGHTLEPWAAYWELKARLNEASPQEVQSFLQRFAGSYQEDRLRNDWLLLLGQRRDWLAFAEHYPLWRMGDDRELRCYAVAAELAQAPQSASAKMADEVRRDWHAQREADDGCALAAGQLLQLRQMKEIEVWKKARLAMESNRPRAARAAVALVAPDDAALVDEVQANPARFLASRATAGSRTRKELVLLAIVKIAITDADVAAGLLDNKWGPLLTAEERHWGWGAIGRQAATKLSPSALEYFAKVEKNTDLSDDMLAWKARASMRQGRWKDVATAVAAMSDEQRADSTWIYWRARSLAAQGGDDRRAEARVLYESIAGTRGFYEQLALEETGERITVPAKPPVPTPDEKNAARLNPGLNRALYAILIGLRSEGTREWNYATNLHTPGGMADRELLAAADFACSREVWDRCINTSERTKLVADWDQRFPMPYRAQVVQRSRDIGLDPAYVYGLIRQESRFIMDARSGVGASGLMQVMPATARWTANKIGMAGFRPEQINDRDTNIQIGTAYLKLALDDFAGSLPLAAAAYNAGPGRPRNWRNGPVLDAAVWAENVPFTETRDYVKKVLANTTSYAAILGGQPQSLKARLGTVGPRDAVSPEPNRDLP